MSLRRQKKFSNTSTTDEFTTPAPINGGNSFDVYTQLQTQEQIDKIAFSADGIDSVGKSIETQVQKYLKESVPNWWVLLQEQANYFCNQFNWDIQDEHLKSLIINVIRGAFYSGIAGIYYNDVTNDYEAVIVSNIEYDTSSRIIKAKYCLAHNYLAGIREGTHDKQKALFTIPKSKIHNLAIFKWGTEALHAWVRILPYVKNQEILMKMLAVQKFAYNKKFVYTCNSPTAALKEMELFFNPEIPFIINAGFSKARKDLENDFSSIELDSKSALEFVQFYKESMSIIYSQIGRRENVDIKKERNVSSEVEASQENYDILLRDVYNQFEIFTKQVNVIFYEHGDDMIELVKKQETKESENEQNDISENIS